MTFEPSPRSLKPPLGTTGDVRRRLLRHHLPLATAGAVVFALFMGLPLFDAGRYPHGDISSGPWPRPRDADRERSADHGAQSEPSAQRGAGRNRHGGHGAGATGHDGSADGARGHQIGGAESAGEAVSHAGPPTQSDRHSPDETGPRSQLRQLTFATGYVAVGYLALTLLVGPANLLLRRRTPVSNYLGRDIGTWAAVTSAAHVIVGLLVHGGGRLSDVLHYFIGPDGALLTNSFGLANWTGFAATIIVLGLFAISSDAALGRLKAGPWKRLQRLNYALFAFVMLHSFFYGAFLRAASPFTILLVASATAVVVGQALGVRRWRLRSVFATSR